MPAIDWLLRKRVEVSWAAFALANLLAMTLWDSWETIPFHFIWISLTLVYGFRVWGPTATYLVLSAVVLSTGAVILSDAYSGSQLWGELFEVPLMSAMFLAMVWHARRRQDALRAVERQAEERASLLERLPQYGTRGLGHPVVRVRVREVAQAIAQVYDVAADRLEGLERREQHGKLIRDHAPSLSTGLACLPLGRRGSSVRASRWAGRR